MATLQYDFRVVGLNSVMAAFKTLEQRALQHNSTISRAFGTGGRSTATGGGTRRQYDAHVRERNRIAQQRAAEERREMSAAVQRNRQWLSFKDRMYREEQAKFDAHARRQISSQKAFEKTRLREQQRAAQVSYAQQRRFSGRVLGGAARGLSTVAGIAGSGLMLGAGMSLASGISGELKLGKTSTLLAVMAKQSGEAGNIKNIQKGIESRVRDVGKESGLDRVDLVSGMTRFFAKSGDVGVAKDLLPFFTEIADISGSSLEDIGDTAGMAFMQAMFKGMTREQAKGETKKILAAFAGQAARGSIEMKDFAMYGPSLLATAARFNGDYGQMAAVTAAIAQTAPFGGANRSAEAATALARFADTIRDKSDEFEKLGVSTYETGPGGTAVARNPIAIIKDVLRKTEGGDERILGKYFTNVRAMRAVAGFNTLYRSAGGGEAGMRAVEKHLNKFLNATLSEKQIKEGATAIRETPGRQFEAAFNNLKDEIGKNLLPALTRLAPAMGKLVTALTPAIEAFGRFATKVAENPWGAVIDAVKIALVASIGRAAIGAAVQAAILKHLAGGPGGLPIPTGGLPVPVPSTGTGGKGLPGTGPMGLFFKRLAIASAFFDMVQMASDAPSKTDEEIQSDQEKATKAAMAELDKTGNLPITYNKPISFDAFGRTFTTGILKTVSNPAMPLAELNTEINQGNISARDFINKFGYEGAQKLGLINASGEMFSNLREITQKTNERAAERSEKAAEMFRSAVGDFQSAIAGLAGPTFAGNLFGSLFGGPNRGEAPAGAGGGGR